MEDGQWRTDGGGGAGEKAERRKYQDVATSDSLRTSIEHLLTAYALARRLSHQHTLDWVLGEPALTPILPLLYYACKDDPACFTPQAWSRCQEVYYHGVAHNLLLYQELGVDLQALNGAGIPTIVLKGAILAEDLYPSIGLRPMGDVDLLVPLDQWSAAIATLERLGYENSSRDPLTADLPLSWADGEHPLCKMDRLALDLHWHLVGNPFYKMGCRIDMEAVWAGAVPLTLAGQPALKLSPEDTLLHLCVHEAVHHCLTYLRGYFDIDQLVCKMGDTFDWDRFVDRTATFAVRAPAWYALSFAHQLLGTPVPPGALRALRPLPFPSALVRRQISPTRFLSAPDLHLDGRRAYAVKLGLLDSPQAFLTVLRNLALPHKGWLTREYPTAEDDRQRLVTHWVRLLRFLVRRRRGIRG